MQCTLLELVFLLKLLSVPIHITPPSIAAATASGAAGETLSFEDALQALEAIVENMERGGTPLEEALAAFERGTQLLKACQTQLTVAEERVRILEGGIEGDLREFENKAAR